MGWEQWDIKYKDRDKATNNLTQERPRVEVNLSDTYCKQEMSSKDTV